jgi:hypothetical protein
MEKAMDLLELFDSFRLRWLAIPLFVKQRFCDFMEVTGVIWSPSAVAEGNGVFHGK